MAVPRKGFVAAREDTPEESSTVEDGDDERYHDRDQLLFPESVDDDKGDQTVDQPASADMNC